MIRARAWAAAAFAAAAVLGAPHVSATSLTAGHPTAVRPTAGHLPAGGSSGTATDPSSCGNTLAAVSAISPHDAWAVGGFLNRCPNANHWATLILHWNGTSWTQVPSPSQAPRDGLTGVSAVSGDDAWAVGGGLMLHWNGKTWARMPVPGGSRDSLYGISARSHSDAWAVGLITPATGNPDNTRTLILHWDGKAWSRVPSPDPGMPVNYYPENVLRGVVAVTADSAWTVGAYFGSQGTETLIARWNGKVWSQVPSPDPVSFPEGPPFTNDFLAGVSARRGTGIWAVGDFESTDAMALDTLTAQWTGTAWSQVASPSPSGDPGESDLYAVSTRSASDVWAVGQYVNNSIPQAAYQPLILHWNGAAWSVVPSPIPASGVTPILSGVSADSASDAWAVGSSTAGAHTLIMHWDGTAWTITNPAPGRQAVAHRSS